MMPIPVPPLPEHLNKLPLDPPEPFCHSFSLAEILSGTHNFDESLVIGQGGFGKVYKGVIDNETIVVAVKRLSSTSKQGDSEFRTEIEMLSKFRHTHIVSLIGYCYSSTEMALVYEYMVNGSLADHLYKTGKYHGGPALSWVQRLKICLGAARGLDYLHTGTGVIHRDVKSSNILLDKNCAAKVSDFGLSRISPIDQSCTHISTNVKGTTGYMDPEYLLTLKLTMKSDVYSFGVVLFEVLCGRQAVDLRLDDEQWSLARWAQHCIEKGTLHQIIDPNLRWEILPKSYTEFARIANQCLCYQSKKRPTMTQVVASLELALALQLGHKDTSAFEMELVCTSEAPENIEKVDSKMVQEMAIKFGSCDDHNKDIRRSQAKPTKRKALRKMLQLLMFRTVREAPVAQLQDPPPVDGRTREGSGVKLRSGTSKTHIDRPEEFLFSDLAAATNNFSLENKIGAGSFGKVYKGKLLDGREVAIKREEMASSKTKKFLREKESSSAFDSELASLSRVHHKNLVRLVGFCESGRDEERLLVYEYMKNEGLYHRLHDKNNVEKSSSPLNSWKMRIKISLDTARGIEYLHNYAVPPIIHRDIKSSNILLDANWTARVSDFGLSMILMGPETDYSSTRTVGTIGYMDPGYFRLNVLTTESDVYSLGVVLLELLTGKRAIFKNGEDGVPTNVVDFAVPAIIAGELPKILDPRVGSQLEENEAEAVELVAYTAIHCVNLEGRERPTMADIVANLERALAFCGDNSHGSSISSGSISIDSD
ncbi:hypothetical protein LguiA_030842 [Lonicera macranthoides]